MEEKEYISNRVEDQINWYSKKSSSCQRWYKGCRIFEIVLAVSIPLVTLLIHNNYCLKIYTAAIGLLIAIAAGLQSLNKWHENWIAYRATSENLKQEKYMYLTRAGLYSRYDDSTCFKEFASRCETIISSENINWTQLQQTECHKISHKKGDNASPSGARS